MLSILNEEAAGEMKTHYIALFDMFMNILTNAATMNPTTVRSCLYALSSLKSMIPYIDDAESNAVATLFPQAIRTSIQIVKSTAAANSSSSSNNDSVDANITIIFDFFQA